MEDRRKFMRFPVSVQVDYADSREGIKGSSVSKDVSREGIGFPVNRQMAKGTLIELQISIPGEVNPVSASGEVVWAKESVRGEDFDTGIKMVKIEPFDRSRLLDYVYREWLKVTIK